MSNTNTNLLAIVANFFGADQAVQFDEIRYVGFPFSISETFQQKNTNSSIAESFDTVEQIRSLCEQRGKELVIYISMGFGNPYGDPYDPDLAAKWVKEMADLDIRIISMADTVGVGNPEVISALFSRLIAEFPNVEFGAHLHSAPHNWEEKIDAAYQAGCRRFDGAIKGFGGCPMADEELVGNMATENLLAYFAKNKEELSLDMKAFEEATAMAVKVFPGN